MVLDTLGLVNVSAVAFLGALVVYAWGRKGARYGSMMAHGASTVQHDLKVAALAVLILLVLGVFSYQPEGVQSLEATVRSVDWRALAERAWRAAT